MPSVKKQLIAFLLLFTFLAPIVQLAHAEGTIGQPQGLPSSKSADISETNYSANVLTIYYATPLDVADHKKNGTTLLKTYPEIGYDIVRINKGSSLQEVIKKYESDSRVVRVTQSVNIENPNLASYQQLAKSSVTTKNIESSLSSKNKRNIQDLKLDKQYYLKQLQIQDVLKKSGKNEVKIALLSTGVDMDHPDLQTQVLPGYNVKNPLQNPNPLNASGDSSGTYSAGIIAADANNGIGGKGINPYAKILPIDIYDGGDSSDYLIAEGILYAIKQKVKIIEIDVTSRDPLPIVQEAINKAVKEKITVVAPAGGKREGEFDTGAYIYPAAYKGVISVVATKEVSNDTYFSIKGPHVTVAAPGENIYSPYYSKFHPSTSFTNRVSTLAPPVPATNIVTGVISLLLSKQPNLTPYEIRYILKHTSKDVGEKGYDNSYGYGLIDAKKAIDFDLKKIPKPFVEPSDPLKNAKKISFSQDFSQTEKLVTENQIHFIQFDVKQGEVIQTNLESKGKTNDLMFTYYFYRKGEKKSNESIVVNEVKNGYKEGKLYTVKEDGILVIGVRDFIGHENKDSYVLTINRSTELKSDGNTVESPVRVTKLPFDSRKNQSDDHYLTGESGDKDYFEVNSDKEQIVVVHLSEVPGVNTGLKVYKKENLNEPLAMSNFNIQSGAESVSFKAEKDQVYVIEANSERVNYDAANYDLGRFEWFYMYELDEMSCISCDDSSNTPYQLTITASEVTPDEDDVLSNSHYCTTGGPGNNVVTEGTPISINTPVTGYFQQYEDCDAYQFVAKEDGIYKFIVGKGTGLQTHMYPFLTIKQWSTIQNDWIDSGYVFDRDSMHIGLQKGGKYLVTVSNLSKQISPTPYTITVELLWKGLNDPSEPNNSAEEAKPFPFKPIIGNFSLRGGNGHTVNEEGFFAEGDWDVFYFKETKPNMYYRFHIEPTKSSLPKGLPTGLSSPLALSDGLIVKLIEDSNGNKILDQEEIERGRSWQTYETLLLSNTFNTKKGMGYFLIASSSINLYSNSTLAPYSFVVQPFGKKDEDATNKVVKNIPSKPIKAVFKGNKSQSFGYLNDEVKFGDTDWYEVTLEKDTMLDFYFYCDGLIDGVITIYDSKGKLVQTINHYGAGDPEQLQDILLPKGKYFIELKDVNYNASLNKYKLEITK
ncbi:S8 family peptidase [Fredinandcohnia humi]